MSAGGALAAAPLWLEDLHVGQTFVSRPVTVTTDEIKASPA